MIGFASSAYQIARHLGPRWIWFRARHALAVRTGRVEGRTPAAVWDTVPDIAEHAGALDFIAAPDADLRARLRALDPAGRDPDVLAEADAILRGEFTLFSVHRKQLGVSPAWHVDPFTGAEYPRVHWSRIHDFSRADIKGVWEPSRFTWAFVLARAYARTGDERYAERFWTLFESWLDANPPNVGVNWKCGQESTFRLWAASFARRVLAGSPSTSPVRVARWRRFVRATGLRIAANLDYALSQSNNHGISETIGLLTAARLQPGAPEASRWAARAQRDLAAQCRALIDAGGGFAQHSTMYHRLMLHALSWYAAMDGRGADLLPDVAARARLATAFLAELTDGATGDAPLCGHHDGSNVLPLSDAAPLDFRPAVRLASALFSPEARVAPAADEGVVWLAGGATVPAPRHDAAVWAAPDAGWFLMRAPRTRVFFHAPRRFAHRPAQADLLHVDVWWQASAITCDPGSYSYNATGRLEAAFADTRVHNTVDVDGMNQMRKVSRFLYLPWPSGESSASADTLRGSHDGYERLGVAHTRTVRRAGEGWIVEDALRASGGSLHRYRLHWLLVDRPYRFELEQNRLVLHCPEGDYAITWRAIAAPATAATPTATLVRADEASDRGWRASSYLRLDPALSLAVEIGGAADASFETVFQPL